MVCKGIKCFLTCNLDKAISATFNKFIFLVCTEIFKKYITEIYIGSKLNGIRTSGIPSSISRSRIDFSGGGNKIFGRTNFWTGTSLDYLLPSFILIVLFKYIQDSDKNSIGKYNNIHTIDIGAVSPK